MKFIHHTNKMKVFVVVLALFLAISSCGEDEESSFKLEGFVLTDNGLTPIAGQELVFHDQYRKQIESAGKIVTDNEGYFNTIIPGYVDSVLIVPVPSEPYLYVGTYAYAKYGEQKKVKFLIPKKSRLYLDVAIDASNLSPLKEGEEYYAIVGYGISGLTFDNHYAGNLQFWNVGDPSLLYFHGEVPRDFPIHFRLQKHHVNEQGFRHIVTNLTDTVFVVKEQEIDLRFDLKF
jgi:hypothetical protein